ncbi:Hypothetical predicted protein [Olea europaea subsp. europaea]|uniref:Uncharacterized protein n=1 Tax=Olea europaea subsp. europaea TaxID=158383 RepID=A0A8S0S325_OLEEU|nr:Hypothetical predicted protein [Olea europaea subsp. europaea]
MDCSEIYDTYGKLFDDTEYSTKYALSPLKLSQRGFDLGTDSDQDDVGDKSPINAEEIDSIKCPNEGRGNSSMNIFRRRSGDKRKGKQRRDKGSKKRYSARDVLALLEQMVSVETDFSSIARSHCKGGKSMAKCVNELLSSGYVKEGDVLHLFALWFLRDKDNQNSYCDVKTPDLCFKFVEYCFERDNTAQQRNG